MADSIALAVVGDIIPALLATAGVAATVAYSAKRFTHEQQRKNDEQHQKNKEPFLTRQIELSFDACDAAACLATTTDLNEWKRAYDTFWRLYWGPLGIVEDRDVEAAMVKFGSALPETMPTENELPIKTLTGASLRLSHSIRRQTQRNWRVDLPTLKNEVPAEQA